jgi:sulfate adenylyltransferase subunit 2
LVHVDTGHNFPETLEFRDRYVKQIGAELIVGSVQDSIDRGTAQEEQGPLGNRNRIQSVTLLETIDRERIDCLMGGGRRDEEKARAKERFFSHRDAFGQWDPKNQRPELWNLFNGAKQPGEHFRVFPISNWTEMNVWHYIRREGIELPSLYFAAPRQVIWRSGSWLPVSDFISLRAGEVPTTKTIRFRTLGDITITGGIESEAASLDAVIAEVETLRQTERGNREDDKRSESSMEERKKQGYF